jgi:hypothetical protein
MTDNDQLAGPTGQDRPVKEPVKAYDARHGTYSCPVTMTRNPGAVKQPDPAGISKTALR